MNTGLRITAFAAALAATFGTAYGVGKGIEPAVSGAAENEPARHDSHIDQSPDPGHGDGGHETAPPGGLQISEGGYTLDLRTQGVTAGHRSDLRFVIRDEGGRAVTAYQREHDKELHLIVASRDLVTYRHLHPARAADGTWSTPVELPEAGGYRVFADFTPVGKGAENLTLGADLAVSGAYEPRKLPAPNATAEVEGYEVELDGALRPGAASELTLKVSRDGRPVTDLQPYLGPSVAGEPGDGRTRPGPRVSFTATAPSAGTYRLFLDFKHEGEVHTAAFTVGAGGAAAPAYPEKPATGHTH
ncbi:hypothetical protein P1P68_15410 [Streptomyces scabiei]|uniref:hypothetical protein n=1 Tax=Streptomyces scabiei TaxID=1930 RepID=UPI00298FF744|nr:hypothetical protein [Streptomyces scabiei]MDW8806136.1 hypothetical protein [Streptomyces scabiei]